MAAPDRARQASLSLPLSGSSVQAAGTWSHNIPHTEQDAHLIHTPLQNPVSFYPHTLRPILKPGNTTLDSQFQLNASHVQKPLSLVPNENAVKNHPVSPARGNSALRDERMSSDTELSSSIDAYEPRGSVHHPLKRESPRECDRRPSPPTDSDDEDPFYFDSILSSPPAKKRDDSPRNTLSSSVLRRASIVPVDPTATPAPHRFSLLRERASEETIFVQEICDAEGRRWSLRVPASGLPEDMVHMLEELENLALELGQALPRIVVTCSAEFSP
ncbi:hypothetical protein B0F90DRAFT_1730557 [Multifurca ochricompacta]|uniref:Uncharacterized protein n=1 Tax=Multifurca ochricompacta TaxID=376703 RepID=A0AAD4M253_9AGAM|nr:hypothetical protein B0F90DRAFT_1730557 [Multifurca ochricompacta]